MTEIIIICGPSGVGKTTLISRLLVEFGNLLDFSISNTTRKVRPGEKEGKDYYYVSDKEFEAKEFYEKCTFSGFRYGTGKDEIKRIVDKGKIPLLDINVKSIQQLFQQKEITCSLIIFIKPPEPILQTLEERLKGRSKTTGENADSIKKRLGSALKELEECEKLHLKNIIINDDLDTAYKTLGEMVLPFVLKLQRKHGVTTPDNVFEDVVKIGNGNTDVTNGKPSNEISDNVDLESKIADITNGNGSNTNSRNEADANIADVTNQTSDIISGIENVEGKKEVNNSLDLEIITDNIRDIL